MLNTYQSSLLKRISKETGCYREYIYLNYTPTHLVVTILSLALYARTERSVKRKPSTDLAGSFSQPEARIFTSVNT